MMRPTRRGFLELVAAGAAGLGAKPVAAADRPAALEDPVAVLVDIPKCIGCRRCEFACQNSHQLPAQPIDAYDDKSVFAEKRRPEPACYTVVDRTTLGADAKPAFTKLNCMHCVRPACVSACLVSALTKQPHGPVVYDASRCMGCRYCMVACPFEMLAYDYSNPLTPQVRKCNLCAHRVPGELAMPACVKICPAEALTYGRRSELLRVAHERIAGHPGRYVDHVYGEQEAGGTSWLFLSAVPFERLGLWRLSSKPASELTEAIQHGVFKRFGPPLMLYGLLGAVMWMTRRRRPDEPRDLPEKDNEP